MGKKTGNMLEAHRPKTPPMDSPYRGPRSPVCKVPRRVRPITPAPEDTWAPDRTLRCFSANADPNNPRTDVEAVRRCGGRGELGWVGLRTSTVSYFRGRRSALMPDQLQGLRRIRWTINMCPELSNNAKTAVSLPPVIDAGRGRGLATVLDHSSNAAIYPWYNCKVNRRVVLNMLCQESGRMRAYARSLRPHRTQRCFAARANLTQEVHVRTERGRGALGESAHMICLRCTRPGISFQVWHRHKQIHTNVKT